MSYRTKTFLYTYEASITKSLGNRCEFSEREQQSKTFHDTQKATLKLTE